jgi:hypothetical protein
LKRTVSWENHGTERKNGTGNCPGLAIFNFIVVRGWQK